MAVHFNPNRLPEQLLEGAEMAIRGPHLEFRVARRLELQQEVVAAIAQLQGGNDLCVAALETLGEAQDRGEQPHAFPQV